MVFHFDINVIKIVFPFGLTYLLRWENNVLSFHLICIFLLQSMQCVCLCTHINICTCVSKHTHTTFCSQSYVVLLSCSSWLRYFIHHSICTVFTAQMNNNEEYIEIQYFKYFKKLTLQKQFHLFLLSGKICLEAFKCRVSLNKWGFPPPPRPGTLSDITK